MKGLVHRVGAFQGHRGQENQGYGKVLATSVTSTSWLMTWLAAVCGAFGVRWGLMLQALCVRCQMVETRTPSSKSPRKIWRSEMRFKTAYLGKSLTYGRVFQVSLGKFQWQKAAS